MARGAELMAELPEGAREVFKLAAGEAFGERNPQMLQRVKRSLLALGVPEAQTRYEFFGPAAALR